MDPNASLDNFNCVDINECATNNSPCGANSICDNTDGGFACGCKFGYQLDTNGQCVDIDECADQHCALVATDFPNLRLASKNGFPTYGGGVP